MSMQIFKYPYNLLRDVVEHNSKILEKYGSIENLDNEDVIQKFHDAKKMSSSIYDVLTMKYKDYTSVEGICIKTDMPFAEVEQGLSDGVLYLSKMYLTAKSTDYWTVYERDADISSVTGISKSSLTRLKSLGFVKLSDIKDCVEKREVFSVLSDSEVELLSGIIKKVPRGNVTFVVVRGTGDEVEGVFVKEGKPLELYTGSLESAKDVATKIVHIPVVEGVKWVKGNTTSKKKVVNPVATAAEKDIPKAEEVKEVAEPVNHVPEKVEVEKSKKVDELPKSTGIDVGNSIVRVPKRRVVVSDNGVRKYVEEREEVRRDTRGISKSSNSIPIVERDKPIMTTKPTKVLNMEKAMGSEVVYNEDADGQSFLPLDLSDSFLERSTPIQDCGFKQSVTASLLHHNITTLEEIVAYSRSEVKHFDKIGTVALKDIDEKLASVGLCLVDSTDTEIESDDDIEFDKGTSTVTVSLPKADETLGEDAELPEAFLMYVRQNHSEGRAYCTVDSIMGLYVDYLAYNDDEENKKVFMSLKSFLGSSVNTSIINVFETIRETGYFSKDMERMSPFYNKCYKLYQKHWIDKIIALNSTGKKVMDYQFRDVTDALYKNTGKVNFSDVFDMCKIVTTPIIDAETLYKCYVTLYSKGVHESTYKHILKRYDVKKRTEITGVPLNYTESSSKISSMLNERNLSGAAGTSINKFCNYYSCSYEIAFNFVDKLLSAVDSNTFPVHYESRNIAVRDFMEIFKGDYGCMSLIAEKYPKFFTCSMEA